GGRRRGDALRQQRGAAEGVTRRRPRHAGPADEAGGRPGGAGAAGGAFGAGPGGRRRRGEGPGGVPAAAARPPGRGLPAGGGGAVGGGGQRRVPLQPLINHSPLSPVLRGEGPGVRGDSSPLTPAPLPRSGGEGRKVLQGGRAHGREKELLRLAGAPAQPPRLF